MGRTGSLQLARVFGIRIGADYSWLLVLFLVLFFLQDQFKQVIDGSDTSAYLAAVAGAFLFFGSIIFHEMGHALAARREGIAVSGIDLFLFGGVMHMRDEPQSPGAEFKVAAAGPAATLLLILIGAGAAFLVGDSQQLADAATLQNGAGVTVAQMLVSIVVTLNVFVLAFNLVPAYPLDGGRITRAIVWKVTGDRNKATRASAALGRGFSWILIGGGLYIAATGDVVTGIWFALIGWLIGTNARGALVHTAFTERLEGITVADIMDAEPVSIPAHTTVAEAYDQYFLRYHGSEWFAVTAPDGSYVGRAFRDTVLEASEGPNAQSPISELAAADAEGRVRDDVPLEALLSSEPLRRLGALMAVDADGRLRGVVTADDVARALRARLAPS